MPTASGRACRPLRSNRRRSRRRRQSMPTVSPTPGCRLRHNDAGDAAGVTLSTENEQSSNERWCGSSQPSVKSLRDPSLTDSLEFHRTSFPRPLERRTAKGNDMDTPALTMVTLTDGSYDVCAAAVRHFARQSVLEKVELIVVCATRDALGEVDEETFRGFHSVKLLPIGTFDTTAEGVAAAVRAASAPLVGLIEEHDFLPPNLAEVVIREMADETVQAVGFGMEPANPGVVAWAHLYLQFGIAVAPVRSGG